MPGIYLHIPFCVKRCGYCDFFSTTLLERRKDYVDALAKELMMRTDYLPQPSIIQTIYFGGGTPSLLSKDQLQYLLQTIRKHYSMAQDAEITLEANPSDLTLSYLNDLHALGVNRLSIGIQSLQDPLLIKLGRRHNAATAKNCVKMAQQAGFKNISIDLMYGLPDQTLDMWQSDLQEALEMNIQHISTYCLSYEKNTQFGKMLAEGKVKEADDDLANAMYETAIEQLHNAGFQHYEVSNFCLPDCYSRHNSAYWNNVPYLGVGAGAHSYNGQSRQWNIANVPHYIDSINTNKLPFECEVLTDNDLYNERVMLSLRTSKGLDLSQLSDEKRQYCLTHAANDIESGLLIQQNNHLIASLRGVELLNRIIENLIII